MRRDDPDPLSDLLRQLTYASLPQLPRMSARDVQLESACQRPDDAHSAALARMAEVLSEMAPASVCWSSAHDRRRRPLL
jgi:hypothetical protein